VPQPRRKDSKSEFLGVGFLFYTPFLKRLRTDISQNVDLLFDMPLTPFFQNGNENAQGVIAQHRAPGDPRNRLGLGNCHRATVVVFF